MLCCLDLGKLDPNKYFSRDKRIELEDAYAYFSELIRFMVEKYKSNKELKDFLILLSDASDSKPKISYKLNFNVLKSNII